MDRPPPDAPQPPRTEPHGEPPHHRPVAPGGFRVGALRTPISTLCAALIVALFLLTVMADGQALAPEARARLTALLNLAVASEAAVWRGAVWTLLTTAFVHGSAMHFGFNLLAHWGLGRLLELSIRRVQLVLLIVAGAWTSSAAQLAVGSGAGVVGFSGVVYAMLGFGWVGGMRAPWLKRFFTRETMTVPLLWLVGCIVATHFGGANIANTAHVVGLAFGGALGMAFAWPGWRVRGLALAGLLTVGATVGLFYMPWSMDWTARRIVAALRDGDSVEAERRLAFSLAHRLDPVKGAKLRVQLRASLGDEQGTLEALEQLRALSPRAAEELEAAARQRQEKAAD